MTTSPDHGQIKLETTTLDNWKANVVETLARIAFPPAGEDRTTSSRCGEYSIRNDGRGIQISSAVVRLLLDRLARSLTMEKAIEAERDACASISDEYARRWEATQEGRQIDSIFLGYEFRNASATIRSRPSVPVTDTEPEAK